VYVLTDASQPRLANALDSFRDQSLAASRVALTVNSPYAVSLGNVSFQGKLLRISSCGFYLRCAFSMALDHAVLHMPRFLHAQQRLHEVLTRQRRKSHELSLSEVERLEHGSP